MSPTVTVFARSTAPTAPTLWARVAATVALWRQRDRERTELALLDTRSLKEMRDHGLEVEREMMKPFWRA